MFFFNLLAAFVEGLSFTFLLASIASLTHESISIPWLKFFNEEHSFFIYLSMAIFLQILRSLALYFGQVMSALLAVYIQKEAQRQIFAGIFKMDFSQVSQLKKGDMIHQATSPPTFIPTILDEYNRLIVSFSMIVAYLLLMGKLSFYLSFIVLIFFILAARFQKLWLGNISKASQIHNTHITDLSMQTTQSLDGLKIVHIFQRQEHMLSDIEKKIDLISTATFRLKKLNALIPSLNECVGVVLVGISLLLGTFFLQKEGVPYASYLFTFLTLTYRLATRLQHVMIAKGVIAYYSGPLKQLTEFLKEKKMRSETQVKLSVNFEHSISFENVSFAYPFKKTNALNEISLFIPKKKITALVGISGAGKSTMIDLLLQLYTPNQGSIKIDGIPIETFSLTSVRDLFGVVPQETFLFNASLEENIRFGKMDATHDEVLTAAKLAGIETFINKLPKGYQTFLGEKGYRLSGGEKQRICFAQALIRNPEILIFDEATSHLDSYSEKIIQETIAELRKEKTMLIVAHRLSTIQMADLIYVMENGRIVEQGTHHKLLQLGGRYHTFWNLQTCIK